MQLKIPTTVYAKRGHVGFGRLATSAVDSTTSVTSPPRATAATNRSTSARKAATPSSPSRARLVLDMDSARSTSAAPGVRWRSTTPRRCRRHKGESSSTASCFTQPGCRHAARGGRRLPRLPAPARTPRAQALSGASMWVVENRTSAPPRLQHRGQPPGGVRAVHPVEGAADRHQAKPAQRWRHVLRAAGTEADVGAGFHRQPRRQRQHFRLRVHELWRNLGDADDQAAFCAGVLMTSTPLVNVTPWTTLGN